VTAVPQSGPARIDFEILLDRLKVPLSGGKVAGRKILGQLVVALGDGTVVLRCCGRTLRPEIF